jgi:hypothetical protein
VTSVPGHNSSSSLGIAARTVTIPVAGSTVFFIASTEGWAQRAADLGWDEVALFGCSAINPLGYLGTAGLMWIVDGGRIIKLRADGADIEAANGPRRTFRRRHPVPALVTLPWLLR